MFRQRSCYTSSRPRVRIEETPKKSQSREDEFATPRQSPATAARTGGKRARQWGGCIVREDPSACPLGAYRGHFSPYAQTPTQDAAANGGSSAKVRAGTQGQVLLNLLPDSKWFKCTIYLASMPTTQLVITATSAAVILMVRLTMGWPVWARGGFFRALLAGMLLGVALRTRVVTEKHPWGSALYWLLALTSTALLWSQESLRLALAVLLSYCWGHGWWLSTHVDWAVNLLLLAGGPFNYVLGMVLASLVRFSHESVSRGQPVS